MSSSFEKYAAKGNEFLQLVAQDLEIPREKAERIVRVVLHALRNRLSHEESFQLMAQLPMVLKAVYVDGWKFSKEFKRISNVEDFLDEIRKEDKNMAGYDLGNNSKARTVVAAVFKAMNYFVSEGEMNDMEAVLPQELSTVIKETLAGSETVL